MDPDFKELVIVLSVILSPVIVFSVIMVTNDQLQHGRYIENYNQVTKCRQSVTTEKMDIVCGELPSPN